MRWFKFEIGHRHAVLLVQGTSCLKQRLMIVSDIKHGIFRSNWNLPVV